MNHDRFIELLNLYVDHQLTPEEARELETAIERNPGRRKTYDEYCRMQQACAQLFEQERSKAPAHSPLSAALAAAERKAAASPYSQRSFWNNPFVHLGGVAAAACLAFVLSRQQSPVPQSTVANNDLVPATVATASTTQQIAAVATQPAPAAPLVGKPIIAVNANASAMAFTSTEPLNTDLSWTSHVQFAPIRKLSESELSFDHPSDSSLQNISLRSNQNEPEQVSEMTALRFQK